MPHLINPQVEIEKTYSDGMELVRNIERYGRVCYKSENKITATSASSFVRNAINRGHFSVIEHEKVTVRIICDRGVSHELVRHRVGSYSQESTRYVDYSKENGMQVITPFFFPSESDKFNVWYQAMEKIEDAYIKLRTLGASPQEARTVLPNSLKTELIVTYNLREWRHFFYLRGGRSSHPQIRELAVMLFTKIKDYIPVIFDDFTVDREHNLITTDICPPS